MCNSGCEFRIVVAPDQVIVQRLSPVICVLAKAVAPENEFFILNENGIQKFLLEDSSGLIQTEEAPR